MSITGLILAGGTARRMGGVDKGLVLLGGESLVAHVARRLRPQVATLVISANRNLDEYLKWADQVVVDANRYAGAGPLAGVLATLQVATTRYLAVVPCDMPRLPENLVARLVHACNTARASYAHDGAHAQFACFVCDATLAGNLEEFLESGERRVESWLTRIDAVAVDFGDQSLAFTNLNTPDDLRAAENV